MYVCVYASLYVCKYACIWTFVKRSSRTNHKRYEHGCISWSTVSNSALNSAEEQTASHAPSRWHRRSPKADRVLRVFHVRSTRKTRLIALKYNEASSITGFRRNYLNWSTRILTMSELVISDNWDAELVCNKLIRLEGDVRAVALCIASLCRETRVGSVKPVRAVHCSSPLQQSTAAVLL